MANFFDQFDAATPTPAAAPAQAAPAAQANPFDQFDAPKPGAADVAADVAKSGGIGVVKGAINFAGLPGDVASLIDAGSQHAVSFVLGKLGVAPEKIEKLIADYRTLNAQTDPSIKSKDIRAGLEGLTGPLYEPKTTAGHYAESVGEFVPAALTGPGGRVRNLVNFAAAPGVASQAAGDLTKGTAAEPWARAGAAIATGGLASIVNRPSAPSQVVRAAIPDGVNPQAFHQAEALVEEAAQRGIRLTMPEALEQIQPGAGKGLLNQMRLLESAPDSRATMAPVFAERPAQMEAAARDTFDTIAPRATDPSMIGPAAGRTAEQSLDGVRAAINAATRPSYDAARQSLVPQNVHTAMMADPLFARTLHEIRTNPELMGPYAGLSDRSSIVYDGVKKVLEQRAQNLRNPVNPNASQEAAANVGTAADGARNIAVAADRNAMGLAPGQGVGNLEQALADQAAWRQQFLEPLQRGPLGQMAGKDTTTRNAVEALFGSERRLPGSEAEVATAVRELSARSNRLANDLVRAHAEMTFDKAARNLQSGENQFGGANFAKALAGNPQDRANLEAAVRALPNGQQIWDGFERFLAIAEATGKRQQPGSLTAFNAQDLKDMSQGRITSEGAKVAVAPSRILSKLGDAWDQWQLGRNLDQLAQILTDPRGAGHLRAIAARPQGSTEAALIAGRLMGVGWTARSHQTAQ